MNLRHGWVPLIAMSLVLPFLQVAPDSLVAKGSEYQLHRAVGGTEIIREEAINPPCMNPADAPSLSDVERVEIDIIKSKDWEINLGRVFASDTGWIDPSRKGSFDFEGFVFYSSGIACPITGTTRITGDYMDHVGFESGRLVASQYLKLETGNVAGIVRLKLFMPRSRNGDSEVIASSLFSDLGFLSPRTTLVDFAVNGANSARIMQEVPAKELLESNLRREGPIIEADGTFLDLHDSKVRDLTPLLGSKVINDKWALDNTVSRQISLDASLTYFDHLGKATSAKNVELQEFELISYLLGTEHGLGARNAVFYFNPISGELEPIYYDGFDGAFDMGSDLWLARDLPFGSFTAEAIKGARDRFSQLDWDSWTERAVGLGAQLSDQRIQRIRKWINQHIDQLSPLDERSILSSQSGVGTFYSPKEPLIDGYLAVFHDPIVGQFQACKSAAAQECQRISNEDGFEALAGATRLEMGELAVFMGSVPTEKSASNDANRRFELENLPEGLFGYSTGEEAHVFFDASSNVLTLVMNSEDTRLLLSGRSPNGLQIMLVSNFNFDASREPLEPRYSRELLTGCLTLYEFEASQNSVYSENAFCEDSVNILNSSGTFDSVVIRNSFQDGLDADFSEISVSRLEIEGAGNDCADVSAGEYKFSLMLLSDCEDKALSGGEGSKTQIVNMQVDGARVAVASKDSSSIQVSKSSLSNVLWCAVAFRKKQEFGGAQIVGDFSHCPGGVSAQSGSLIRSGS